MNRMLGSAALIILLAGCQEPTIMGVDDIDRLALAPAGERVAYGDGPLQFGELSLPDGPGPHPTVVFIHGGCWLAAYDLTSTRALAQALVRSGYAVWNIEYRRVGDAGGGWPGTFMDVARATDHLRGLADRHPIDLDRVVVMGHSAGGHLALWVAARQRLRADSDLFVADPLPVAGVVGLAPAPQLESLHAREVCGHVIDKLMGGGPDDHRRRYHDGSPVNLVPLGVPQIIIVGKYDEGWAWAGRAYVNEARAIGDAEVELIEARHAGHFEMINPDSSTWRVVRHALRQLTR